jgi:thiamine biosynthesis lipoprotein ApbE
MRSTERIASGGQMPSTRATWRDWSCTVGVSVDKPGDLQSAATIVRRLMEEVAHAVSRFRDDSELSRCNQRAGRVTR